MSEGKEEEKNGRGLARPETLMEFSVRRKRAALVGVSGVLVQDRDATGACDGGK